MNNSATPTTGPWTIDTDSPNDELLIRSGDDSDSVVCAVWPMEHDAKSDETSQANARLIAAAPELLEALRGMLDAYDGMMNGDQTEESVRKNFYEAATPALAAIAKAGGGK